MKTEMEIPKENSQEVIGFWNRRDKMVPKFRAWDRKNKVMRDVKGLIWEETDLIAHCPPRGHEFNEWFTVALDGSKYQLMQSTGLKDINSVEIFEGDIVNHFWSNEVGESFCHKTVIKNPFDYKVNEAMHLTYADELEILGNIWENPELLEGECRRN